MFQYFEIKNEDRLCITGDLTVEFWLYLREWPEDWTNIVSKFIDDQNNEFCFRIKNADVGQWYYGDGNNAVPALTWSPKKDIQLNKWTHIACVRRIGEYGKTYFNGSLLREKCWKGQNSAVATAAPIIFMGSSSSSNVEGSYHGDCYELRMWNIAKEQEDIISNMNTGLAAKAHGLAGCWNLSENKALDCIGSNHGKHYQLNDSVDFSKYDFVDFGCKTGDSIKAAKELFFGGKGIGLDINFRNVIEARNLGYEAAWFDVTKLTGYSKQVRFVIMSHFLEHLPGYESSYKCVRAACSIANDFIFIRQPYFDADAYLFSKGLKLYWSDWRGHPNRMTSLEMFCILRTLKIEELINSFKIYNFWEVKDSNDNCVHPLQSPIDTQQWVEGKHLSKKKKIRFNNKVFREMLVLVSLNKEINLDKLEKSISYTNEIFSWQVI